MINRIRFAITALLFASNFSSAADAKDFNFYITNANIDLSSCASSARDDLEFACHRFEKGSRFAILSRSYFNQPNADRDTFFKTTILFLKKPILGRKINLPNNDVFAFHSYGPSSFPGSSGCYGQASSGEIEVNKGLGGTLNIDYKIKFDMKSPHGYSECRSDDEVSSSFLARAIDFNNLTPWLGLKTKASDSWDESHPN